MTSFLLKIIAVTCMFFDHFGDALIGHFSFFNLIGRIAFPIFAFQISEGYIHTKNIKKYISKLFIFGCISQIAFYLFLSKFNPKANNTLNIFFTLLLGLLSILAYDYFSKIHNSKLNKTILGLPLNKMLGLLVVCIISCLAQVIHVDYGYWGIIVIFCFYLFKNNKSAMIISFISLCLLKYITWIIMYGFNYSYILLCAFTILSILPISFYSGKQGYRIKYFLYIFYPLHLLLLYLIF